MIDSFRKGAKDKGGLLRNAKKLTRELNQLSKAEERLKDEEDQTEEEEMGGADPKRIRKELDYEVEQAEEIAERLDTVEENMWKVLEGIKNEEGYVLREEKDIDKGLSEVADFIQDARQEIERVRDEYQQYRKNMDAAPGQESGETDLRKINQEAANDLHTIREGPLQNLEDLLREEQDVQQELDQVIPALKGLKENAIPQIEKDIQQLEYLIEEQADAERKGEELAQRAQDREDGEAIMEDAQETKKLLKEKAKLEKHKDKLNEKLEEEIEQLRKEKQYQEQEMEEIREVVSGADRLGRLLGDLEGLVDTVNSGSDTDAASIKNAIEEVNAGIRNIEDEANQVIGA